MRERLSDADVAKELGQLKGWEREGHWLRKQYKFDTFAAGVAFVNRVAQIAEEMDHHPDIDLRYDKVRLLTSTHSAGGLTSLDFELARRIDDEAAG